MEMNGRKGLDKDLTAETSTFLFPEAPTTNDGNEGRVENGKPEPKESQTNFCGRYSGIVLSIVSALIFPLGSLAAKCMVGYHPFTLAVYRFQGFLLPSIILLPYAECVQKKPVLQTIWPLTNNSNAKNLMFLVIRGFSGCLAIVFHYYSIKYLTIADALIIGSMKPVVVTLVAHVILREKFLIFPICVAIWSILGAGVILRPPILTGKEEFDQGLLVGGLYAFGAVIAVTFTIIIMRYLRKIHVSVVHFVFGTSGTILTLVMSLSFGVFVLPYETRDILYAVALAAVALIVQTLGIFSLKKEQAGIVTLCRTTEIVFAMFWQFIFLGVVPDVFSLAGAGIVMVGIILITWSKWLSTLPLDHPSRNRYSFALK